MADNMWEPAEQVFAPTKVQAYHGVHPMERAWPHKRAKSALVKLIRSCFPCQTPLPPQVRKLLSLTVPLQPQLWKPPKMPLNPRLPQRYPLRSRLRKTKICPSDPLIPEPAPFVLSPPFRPYRFSEPTQQGRHKNKSEKSLNRSLPPSKDESLSSGPVSSDTKRGMSGHGQISIGSEQRRTSELTKLPPVHRALSLMAPALSIFGSPSGGDPPKPVTSDDPPETLQLLKELWGGPTTTSTITSSMLAHTCPPGMSALPQRVRYLVGSEPCSMWLILDFEPSSPELKTSTIEELPPTFSDITARLNESMPSQTSERTLKQGWQGLVKSSASAVPAAQSDWPLSSTSRVFPMARSQTWGPPHTSKAGTSDDDEGKVKDNLPYKWRVMSSTPSGYMFCQYLSPEVGHDGGPCDCMMRVGSRG